MSDIPPGVSTGENAGPELIRGPWVFVLAVLVAATLALAVSAQTYLSMLGHGHSFVAIVAWQLSCWTFWAVAGPFVLRAGGELSRSSWQRGRRVSLRLGSLGVALVGIHVALASWLTLWFQPYLPVMTTDYGEAFMTQLASLFPVDMLAYVTLTLLGWGLSVQYRARRLEVRESQLEADLARAHLETLHFQIQPHFLFNTLNAISALIRLRSNDRALEMLVGLSDLMRRTLDRTGQQTVTLDAEMDFLKRYADLQQARFADRLELHYEIASECRGVAVPAFVLQPLVENAIRHGVGQQSRRCRIDVGARLETDGRLHLWVSDDGTGLTPGFSLERDARTGLRNTRLRLQHLYGQMARLELSGQPGGGTRADVWIPSSDVGATEATA